VGLFILVPFAVHFLVFLQENELRKALIPFIGISAITLFRFSI